MPSASPNILRPARVVEVAPGTRILPPDLKRVPSVCVSELVWHNVTFRDGSQGRALVPVDRVHDRWMRLSEIESRLHLGVSAEVMQKLCYGGFISYARPGPDNILVDIVSLLEHFEETSDPDYWTKERRQRYKDGTHGSCCN